MIIRGLPEFLAIIIFIFLILFNIVRPLDIYAPEGKLFAPHESEKVMSEESLRSLLRNEQGSPGEKLPTVELSNASPEVQNAFSSLLPPEEQKKFSLDTDIGQLTDEELSHVLKPFYKVEFRKELSSSVDKYTHDFDHLSKILTVKLIAVLLPFVVSK